MSSATKQSRQALLLSSDDSDSPSDTEPFPNLVYERPPRKRECGRVLRRSRLQLGKVPLMPCAVSSIVLLVLLCLLTLPSLSTFRPRLFRSWHSREKECTTWPQTGRHQEPNAPVRHSTSLNFPRANSLGSDQIYKKPQGFKIAALIFYGRRETVDILDCYLQRNLVSNGGFLDEVQWVVNTNDQDDVAYINDLAKADERYRLVYPSCEGKIDVSRFDCLWNVATDPETLYIKIDDDMTFMSDSAIPSLVMTRLALRRNAYAVGANSVNSYMAAEHYRSGAVHAYLPERKHRCREHAVTWRASELPFYGDAIPYKAPAPHMEPPYPGHRWLPIQNATSVDLLQTPIHHLPTDAKKARVKSWPAAAQQHYSLLQNIEDGALHRYHVGEMIWTPQSERYSLNFIAIWGADVRESPPKADDERETTADLRRTAGRPFVVDMHAVAAHLSFAPQEAGIRQTDLLDRYRAYANEMVCPAGRKKRPLVRTCPGF